MSRYEFAKRSNIPVSTLRSLEKKEDYDMGESNIQKMAEGMGVAISELFGEDTDVVYVNEKSEKWLVQTYRKLSDRKKGVVEGFIKALILEESEKSCYSAK